MNDHDDVIDELIEEAIDEVSGNLDNFMMTPEEIATSIERIRHIETNSKLEIGRELTELKEKTSHGQWEVVLEKLSYSETYAREVRKMYSLYGQNDAQRHLSESQMFELAKTSAFTRPFLEQAILEFEEENPTITVPVSKMRAAKGLLSGELNIDLEDFKRQLAKPVQDINPSNKSEDWVSGFAIHLKATARMAWEADASIQELSDAVVLDHHSRAMHQVLRQKLTAVWDLHGIDGT